MFKAYVTGSAYITHSPYFVENGIFTPIGSLFSTEHNGGFNFAIDRAVAKLCLRVRTRVTNIDYEKRVIESFPYNTSVYYTMYKRSSLSSER